MGAAENLAYGPASVSRGEDLDPPRTAVSEFVQAPDEAGDLQLTFTRKETLVAGVVKECSHDVPVPIGDLDTEHPVKGDRAELRVRRGRSRHEVGVDHQRVVDGRDESVGRHRFERDARPLHRRLAG
jgi:hypothetical protein